MRRSDENRGDIARWGVASIGTLLAMLAMSCSGELGSSSAASTSGSGTTPPPGPGDIAACPQDPDWALSGMGRQECPAVWRCETIVGGTKRCTNPGPDLPDGTHTWACARRSITA